jgi:electron transfer flavoprotein beta subunit
VEIVVLIKPIPEAESRLRATPDGRGPEPEGIKFVLAGYDESAVEQALLLKESLPGSSVHAVSFGPARCEETLRAAIALGADRATWVEGPPEGSDDPVLAARALAATLQTVPHDLVLGGKQAGDDEEGIVPGAIAELLGIPSFGYVTDLRSSGPSGLMFLRPTEAGVEQWEAPLPCVVGLQQAWNDPRSAKLPNILKSRKAPILKVDWPTTSTALALEAKPRSIGEKFELPAPRTGAKMIEFKTPEEAAEKLVRLLREEAKVFP